MVAKIRASATTGRHCALVNEVNLGRTVVSRTAPATHCPVSYTHLTLPTKA